MTNVLDIDVECVVDEGGETRNTVGEPRR